MTGYGRHRVLVSLVAGMLWAMEPLSAQAVTWDGGGNGTAWGDPLNWDPNALPVGGDDVIIGAAGGITVTINLNVTINSLTSAEAVHLISGTLTIAATSQINNAFTHSGGTLTGTGDVTVTGLYTWNAGTISGTGGTLFANGGMAIGGNAGKDLRERTIENAATATWTGTGNINSDKGAVFNNLATGTFDVQNNRVFETGRTL